MKLKGRQFGATPRKGRSQLDLWRAIKELQKLADAPEPKKEEQEVKRENHQQPQTIPASRRSTLRRAGDGQH